jgi:hypothetical protein
MNELILPSEKNGNNPPVESFVRRVPGAKTGIRLISYQSLINHIRTGGEFVATKSTQAESPKKPRPFIKPSLENEYWRKCHIAAMAAMIPHEMQVADLGDKDKPHLDERSIAELAAEQANAMLYEAKERGMV